MNSMEPKTRLAIMVGVFGSALVVAGVIVFFGAAIRSVPQTSSSSSAVTETLLNRVTIISKDSSIGGEVFLVNHIDTRILRIEYLRNPSQAPLELFLSADTDNTSSVDLGHVTANLTNSEYLVPDGLSLTTFHDLLLVNGDTKAVLGYADIGSPTSP